MTDDLVSVPDYLRDRAKHARQIAEGKIADAIVLEKQAAELRASAAVFGVKAGGFDRAADQLLAVVK